MSLCPTAFFPETCICYSFPLAKGLQSGIVACSIQLYTHKRNWISPLINCLMVLDHWMVNINSEVCMCEWMWTGVSSHFSRATSQLLSWTFTFALWYDTHYSLPLWQSNAIFLLINGCLLCNISSKTLNRGESHIMHLHLLTSDQLVYTSCRPSFRVGVI